jgi:hypothetical protein
MFLNHGTGWGSDGGSARWRRGMCFPIGQMQPIVTGSTPHLGKCEVVRGTHSYSKIRVRQVPRNSLELILFVFH